uniref:BTB domain-containing protein n=1 Tax=Strongyloides papillosus TaxID=174720 RepID=A0A0N5BR02_STREA
MDQKRKREINDISTDDSHNIIRKIYRFSFVYSIQKFSLRTEKTGESLTSPTFVTGWKKRSEWCLNETKKLRAFLRFSILNEKEDEENVVDDRKVVYFDKNNGFGIPKFIKKDFLLDKSNGLLVNDKLTILFTGVIAFYKSDNQNNPETPKQVTIPQSKLSLDYGDMFDSPLFTDCIIKIGDTEIKVHKAVLAARSPVFYDTFNTTLEKSQTNIIEIEDFRVEVVREMLKYIYTDEVSNILLD